MNKPLEVKMMSVPDGLPEKLRNLELKYTTPVAIYHCVWLWGNTYCGVFGDGANGAYEWFFWDKNEKPETSDYGYESGHIALRDILLEVEPVTVKAPIRRKVAQ